MNVRIQPPLRNSLAACLCLAAVLLAAGCSAAPPGATRNSPAVGPVQRAQDATNFAAVPGARDVQRPRQQRVHAWCRRRRRGTSTRRVPLHGQARHGVLAELHRHGHRPRSPARRSASSGASPAATGTTRRASPSSPRAAAQGKSESKVLVTAAAGARWESGSTSPPRQASAAGSRCRGRRRGSTPAAREPATVATPASHPDRSPQAPGNSGAERAHCRRTTAAAPSRRR